MQSGNSAFDAQQVNSAFDVVQTDLEFIIGHLQADFKQASGKSVLITGGAGFLGYYMTQALLHWNQVNSAPPISVIVTDSFSRGAPAWLHTLEDDPNLLVYKHDIADTLLPQMLNADYIVHAASIASPMFYREYPIEVMDANVNGLRQLLDHMVTRSSSENPVSGLLFFSTSEIYGDPDAQNVPTSEDYRGSVSCTGPRACYDESKRYGETLSVNFAQQHNLPVRIVRPFNNYGPGLKITDKRAPPDIAKAILNGDDVLLLSDGSPTRTFCYIADAVIGYYRVLFRGKSGRPYNIGNDAPEISVREFAQRNIDAACKLWGYDGEITFATSADANYLTDNPQRRCPDISRARTELGYSPGISLEAGIKQSLLWYADNQSAEEK